MPLVPAIETLFTPLSGLRVINSRYRKQRDGMYETPFDFLPQQNYLYMCPVTVLIVTFSWAKSLLKETDHLRLNGEKIFLVMGEYACHITLRTLFILKYNAIIFTALSAHTFNALQTLYVDVFGQFRNYFTLLLSKRTIITSQDAWNDVFIICHLHPFYHQCVPIANIVGRFDRFRLFNMANRSCDLS